jgi:hypothetical protein
MMPVNAMLEVVGVSVAEVSPLGEVMRTTAVVASPGVRFAVDVAGVQVVPGLALPLRLTGEQGADLFVYLSLEHAFRSAPVAGGRSSGEP